MKNGNEIACRFLSNDYFMPLYEAFTEAYADYVVPFDLNEAQFRNHINLTAVDLARSVGCIESGRLVAFSLNGFGQWAGRSTAYDAGTGVVPDRRRRGLSRAMFEMMLPAFEEAGIEQVLLEAVSTNSAALGLYDKLGFRRVRRLALLQLDGKLTAEASRKIEIRDIDKPDWEKLETFWDGIPSWQNSIDAVDRSRPLKRILGAFIDQEIAGYVVFSSRFGRIAQIAVDKNYRKRGVGTALLYAMQQVTAADHSMQVINIDMALNDAVGFFTKLGFYERLSQHEMLLEI